MMASDISYPPCPSLVRPGPLIVLLGAVPCLTMPRLMKMSNQKHDLMSGLGLGCQAPCELWSHHTPRTLTTVTTDRANRYTDVECIFGHLRLFYSGCFGELKIHLYPTLYPSETPAGLIAACKAAIDSFPR